MCNECRELIIETCSDSGQYPNGMECITNDFKSGPTSNCSDISSTIDFEMDCDNPDIMTDIIIDEFSDACLWGHVKNCKNKPIPNACVKLVKVISAEKCMPLAETMTDNHGFYKFDMCNMENCAHYKIILCGYKIRCQDQQITEYCKNKETRASSLCYDYSCCIGTKK